MRPLLLLDVDGVVCPLGDAAPDQVPIASTHVSLSHHRLLPGWLAELAKVFELVWATTWEHDANELLAPLLGLPDLPVIQFAGTVVGPGETVKLPAIRRFVDDRAFAWVDDRLGVDATAWGAHRLAPTLLRDIDPASGLTRCDIDGLLAFATNPQR
ncbi:HAD domain-containing protein [Solirubrobacter deserti]|uniref:HAD domain-containing protein n=1 Tax=Solirubrobacter deserti TaxID=2282478 RepID=A0ABT4RVN7_9ACTN|nr:HAD domain-containing protein [Solirubrobacter deserti]MDA0142562.1 HAD domain-containing protein [Solirubrobacter deserti]